MSYSVYIAVNILNGKRYIGVTGKGVRRRSRDHWRKARAGGNECPRFYGALRKYGRESFAWKILFESDDMATAYHHEYLLVRDLQPEYNSMEGGKSPPANAGWNRRSVLCLEDGLEYGSAMDAADFYSVDLSELCKVLRGEKRWTKGLHFCYASEATSEVARAGMIAQIDDGFIRGMLRVEVRKQRLGKVVDGRDGKGRSAAGPMAMSKKVVCVEDGRVFDSVSDAARHYDVDDGSVSRVCNGIRRSVAGRVFKFLASGSEAIN